MHTDPQGRAISEDEALRLLLRGTHTIARLDCGRLTVVTRWWGLPERPWLTRAWLDGGPTFGTLIRKEWSPDRASALDVFQRVCRLTLTVPPLPLLELPQQRRSSGAASVDVSFRGAA